MIQKKHGFRFGEDSVFLAALTAQRLSPEREYRLADLGAGCGALSLLLAARLPGIRITAVEIDRISLDVLTRNVQMNRLTERITVTEGDIRQLAQAKPLAAPLKTAGFDGIICNPPYRVEAHALSGPDCKPSAASRKIALEEAAMSLEDLCLLSRRLLKPGGRLYMIHRPHRLPDLLSTLRENRLEPRELVPIQAFADRAPVSLYISAQYLGRPGGFVWQPALIVRKQDRSYTEAAEKLYGHDEPLDEQRLLQGIRLADTEQELTEILSADRKSAEEASHDERTPF